MNVSSEQEMLDFGRKFANKIKLPMVIELVGDVGVGKTTFVRGLAEGLNIKGSVTSPSFTISKSYTFTNNGRLVHYDFYRLPDPGLMLEDLNESINDKDTLTIIEWGNTTTNILPNDRVIIKIEYNEDGSRSITF